MYRLTCTVHVLGLTIGLLEGCDDGVAASSGHGLTVFGVAISVGASGSSKELSQAAFGSS